VAKDKEEKLKDIDEDSALAAMAKRMSAPFNITTNTEEIEQINRNLAILL